MTGIVECVVLGCVRVRERTCVCVCVWMHDAFICNVTHSYATGSLLHVSSLGVCVREREREHVCVYVLGCMMHSYETRLIRVGQAI